MMDDDVINEDLAVLDPGEFGGFDNEGLDFRHLAEYINGEDENSIYFPESLVSDHVTKENGVVLSSPLCTSNNNNTNNLHHHHHHHHHLQQQQQHHHHAHHHHHHLGSNGVLDPSAILYESINSASTAGAPPPHQQQSPNGFQNKNNSSNNNSNHIFNHPHHLPDSPPDSGSEPPYSPPNEEPKLTMSMPVGSLTEMLIQPLNVPSPLKHALPTYTPLLPPPQQHISVSATQPLKHLPPDVLSTINNRPSLPPPPPPLPQQQQQQQQLQLQSQRPPHLVLSPVSPRQNGAPPTAPPPPPQSQSAQPPIPPLSHPPVYPINGQANNANQPTKKRKLSDSPTNSSALQNGSVVHIKQEPGSRPANGPPPLPPRQCLSPDAGSNQSNSGALDDEFGFDFGSDNGVSSFNDSTYQLIQFQVFQQPACHVICDRNLKELPSFSYRVDADKGFNFSNADEAFVCQKKNHFQVTVHVQFPVEPHFVQTPEGLKKIDAFYLHFYGVKVESPSQTIKVEQSQSDRSKKPFHPVFVEFNNDQAVKVTVGRLHFSETTSNNMRKKGKPNPDQRYFHLVVALHAHCGDSSYPTAIHASERIIVRASNPGQFESDAELSWQKGHTPESIFHAGRVGINTDRPDESLVVHGNIKLTGHLVQPSDIRAKENIEEVDTKEQLRNLQQLRLVRYQYNEDFAKHAGLLEEERCDTGVIAQEVQKVIPEAVKEVGEVVLPSGTKIDNFLVVNKERIFIENIGAIKELCKVTDNLGNRIDELERMNQKLNKPRRIDSLKSTSSGSTIVSRSSSARTITKKNFNRRHHPLSERGFCSNKFVQITIVILILVMALCLVAMATLYILEWQKRQVYDVVAVGSNIHPNIGSNKTRSSSAATFGNFSFDFVGPGNRTKSANGSHVLKESPTEGTKPQVVVSVTSSTFTVRVQGKRTPLGIPTNCIGALAKQNRCLSYCCSNVTPMEAVIKQLPVPRQFIHAPSTSIPLTTTATLSTSSTTTTTTTTTTVRSSTIQERPSPRMMNPNRTDSPNWSMNTADGKSDVVENGENLSLGDDPNSDEQGYFFRQKYQLFRKETRNREKNNTRQKRLTPSTSTDGISTSAGNSTNLRSILNAINGVRIVELNYTFSNEYCLFCRSNNMTFNIPLSRYMSPQSLSIQFVMSTSESVYVDYCLTKNMVTKCSQSLGSDWNQNGDMNHERKSGESTLTWVLPIGMFIESHYKFRISQISRHSEACLANPEDANTTFIEYNFLFYRTCEE